MLMQACVTQTYKTENKNVVTDYIYEKRQYPGVSRVYLFYENVIVNVRYFSNRSIYMLNTGVNNRLKLESFQFHVPERSVILQ